jgi:hypothetical protein
VAPLSDNGMTPPKALVQEWAANSPVSYRDDVCDPDAWRYESFVAGCAALWAAERELEACCEWLSQALNCTSHEHLVTWLREARRPQRINLRRVALLQLEQLDAGRAGDVIRQALEQLPDD